MKIRPAVLSDASVIGYLFDQYRIFYRQQSDIAAATAFISERMQKGESVIFLAETSNGAAGFAQLYPSYSSISMRRLWILNDLFVAPVFRGQGAGKVLLEACTSFAQENGAKGVTLKTAVDNRTAQRLYEACGWKREEQYVSYNFNFPPKV